MTDLDPARHLRVLHPAPGIWAFYDGRVAGQRFAEGPNWVDRGALSLGIASFVLVDGDEAVVYDTHVTAAHAARIRAELTAAGVRRFTVVLSHCHLDHVAGTAAFADYTIIANDRTAAHLARDRAAIEAGTQSGPPAVRPLVLPNLTFSGEMTLAVGRHSLRLIEANVHSDDATVIWRDEDGLMLAGDTVEDTVTYVSEPQDLAVHLRDLARLAALAPRAVLPNHGDPGRIAAGGYGPALLDATAEYVGWLQGLAADPGRADIPLREVIANRLADGTLTWFDGYLDVHAANVAAVLGTAHG